MNSLILMYHGIADGSESATNLHSVSARNFREQISHLMQSGYVVAPWQEMALKSERVSGVRVGLTFDDGNASDIESAKTLSGLGYSALFFVSTGYLGSAGYLGREDVSELRRLGMGIGSHSHRHVQLTTLSDADVQCELKKSKEILEEVIQQPVEHLSFPGGAYNTRTLDIASRVGYKYFFTSDWGINRNRQFTTRILRRVPILYNYQTRDFERVLQMHNYRAKLILFHSKELMKKTFGASLYVKLRQVFINLFH